MAERNARIITVAGAIRKFVEREFGAAEGAFIGDDMVRQLSAEIVDALDGVTQEFRAPGTG